MSAKLEAIFSPKRPEELTQHEKEAIGRIKTQAVEMARTFHPADNREKAIAMTKLEECAMWAVKGVLQK